MDHEVCAACGFDGAGYEDGALLEALRTLGSRWRAAVDGAGGELRVRPGPATWSAIEYAAHSRDVTALHVFGVEQALAGDEPAFPAIDGEDLIQSAAGSYHDADEELTVAALGDEACRLAALAGGAGGQTWSRGLTIGTSRMDIRRLLEHALHDSLHHLADVDRGVRTIRHRQG